MKTRRTKNILEPSPPSIVSKSCPEVCWFPESSSGRLEPFCKIIPQTLLWYMANVPSEVWVLLNPISIPIPLFIVIFVQVTSSYTECLTMTATLDWLMMNCHQYEVVFHMEELIGASECLYILYPCFEWMGDLFFWMVSCTWHFLLTLFPLPTSLRYQDYYRITQIRNKTNTLVELWAHEETQRAIIRLQKDYLLFPSKSQTSLLSTPIGPSSINVHSTRHCT